MIYLQLFAVFFLTSICTFGGGYASIPILKEQVVGRGWISEDLFTTYMGISEATPGPFAINLATFVGKSQGGFFGSVMATLGFIMPSLLIIIIVAIILDKFLRSRGVRTVVNYIKPVAAGLVLVTGLFVILNAMDYKNIFNGTADLTSLGILLTTLLIMLAYKKATHKNMSPFFIIIIGACLGMIAFIPSL